MVGENNRGTPQGEVPLLILTGSTRLTQVSTGQIQLSVTNIPQGETRSCQSCRVLWLAGQLVLADACYFDFVSMLFCLRKIILHLQAAPHFGGTAEPLFQPDRHVRGNAGLLVDQIVQGLPLHAKRARLRSRTGRAVQGILAE